MKSKTKDLVLQSWKNAALLMDAKANKWELRAANARHSVVEWSCCNEAARDFAVIRDVIQEAIRKVQ